MLALAVFFGDIAEDEDSADDGAGGVVDGGAAVGDVAFGAIAGDEDGMVGEGDDLVVLQGGGDGDEGGLAGFRVEDVEDIGDGASVGVGSEVASEGFGDGVHVDEVAAGIAGDDAIADGAEGGGELFFAGLELVLLGADAGVGAAEEEVDET